MNAIADETKNQERSLYSPALPSTTKPNPWSHPSKRNQQHQHQPKQSNHLDRLLAGDPTDHRGHVVKLRCAVPRSAKGKTRRRRSIATHRFFFFSGRGNEGLFRAKMERLFCSPAVVDTLAPPKVRVLHLQTRSAQGVAVSSAQCAPPPLWSRFL